MRVLFFGTPEFAVPSLAALVGEGFDVVSVVTRPDSTVGRHRSRVEAPAVKRAALAEELPVLQPENPAESSFVSAVRALQPDVSVVVAYGHILRSELLQVPRLGSLNVHASLLPLLRGAAPIQRAIMEGHEQTGVTVMQMDAGMDTGPILHQVGTPITPDETGGELTLRLSEMGALALVEALTLMDGARLAPRPQDDARATFAPKLSRDDERIDWLRPAEEVARKIRALDPSPGSWTDCRGAPLKLFGARVTAGVGVPGLVIHMRDVLRVACGKGAVEISEVQHAGKARMSARAFANGRGILEGDRLL